jgi:hypothetical protein
MRKILITLGITVACIATLSILWIFAGRQLSLFIDRFGTIKTASQPIKSISYEGSGTGGVFVINGLHLSLGPADSKSAELNVGTTKDNQLALSFESKVFAFGPLRSSESDQLAMEPKPGDDAVLSIGHSALDWIEPFNLNFMTVRSPSWNRYLYNRLIWRKQNGAKLEMLWRYQQPYSPGDGWTNAIMIREGATGLIGVDITLGR